MASDDRLDDAETLVIPLDSVRLRNLNIFKLIRQAGMAESIGQARRLCQQGAVSVQTEPAEREYPWEKLGVGSCYCVSAEKGEYALPGEFLLRVGKRMKKVMVRG